MTPAPHPRAAELVARTKLRRKIETAIDHLLAILDELDGDPEAEPSLGAPEQKASTYGFGVDFRFDQRQWTGGANDDREDVNEDGTDLDDGELDTSDMEPSLGAPENLDQTHWAQGNHTDREDNGDERDEPDTNGIAYPGLGCSLRT